MGLLDFAAGYVLGGKAGNQGIDEVVGAAREILRSKEFQALLAAARSHAGATLKQLGELVDDDEITPPSMDNVLDMVKALVERRENPFGNPFGASRG